MRRIFILLLLLIALALPAFGQGLEELARQRIAQETGLDKDLIATMFVSEDNAQFILTFIYIEDRTFNSRLKPELLAAIAPYRNREALLVLVTPARESYFNPLLISFTQDRMTYDVRLTSIRRIDESFTAGSLPTGEVSSGIILLDRLESRSGLVPAGGGIKASKPFQISYMGRYTADFALSPGEPLDLGLGIGGESNTNIGLLQSLLLYLLFLLLIPFLLI